MRKIIMIGALWCAVVALMCAFACHTDSQQLAGKPKMDFGLIGQIRVLDEFGLIGQIGALAVGTLTLLLANVIRRHTRSLTDQINNVHHEDGEKTTMRELLLWTHAYAKNTNDLALDNQKSIQQVKDEQSRVRDELEQMKDKNCPFHEENNADISAIKKRLGMEGDEPA